MSCNGCRVLRKGCSEACVLRTCLQWIESPEAQGNATLFLAKFFGRSDLLSFVSAVPDHQRPALFQSLLFEACGRTVNPVNGAVGLLSSGNWHVCQAAVETVLAGGALHPMQGILAPPPPTAPRLDDSSAAAAHRLSRRSSMPSAGAVDFPLAAPPGSGLGGRGRSGSDRLRREAQRSAISGSVVSSDVSVVSTGFGIGDPKERKLLNLFV